MVAPLTRCAVDAKVGAPLCRHEAYLIFGNRESPPTRRSFRLTCDTVMMHDTVMKAREVVKVLKGDGWTLVRINGSHHIFSHPTKPVIISLPIHSLGADVPTGLLNKIFKDAGLK
jgi:predicted RNA binding protein YcfA (HicA-like mRNA interferase family)